MEYACALIRRHQRARGGDGEQMEFLMEQGHDAVFLESSSSAREALM